jgi:MarR family transcriptional regulator, 2-MHQ and catechol-resistance regulon repressor
MQPSGIRQTSRDGPVLDAGRGLSHRSAEMNDHQTTQLQREASPEAEQARALKLWVVLARAYAAVQTHSLADIERHGLTVGEFGILESLFHKGPMLLGEVQKRILVSSGGITYLVDRLEAKGLVERQECPGDRRARFAALTEQGEALIRQIFPGHAQCIEHALSGLDAEEQERAIALLRRLGRTAAEASPRLADPH